MSLCVCCMKLFLLLRSNWVSFLLTMMWTVIREKEIKSQCLAELPNFCTGSCLRKYGVECSDLGQGGCQRSVLAASLASAKQKSVFTFCTMTRPGCSDTTFPRVESLRTQIKSAIKHQLKMLQNIKMTKL